MKKRTKSQKRGTVLKKMQTLHNEPGLLKMSEALEKLVASYVHEARTEQEYDALIGLGAMAWNMTMMPPETRKNAIKDAIAMFGQDPENIQFLSERLNVLMQRKEKLFPDEDRVIVSYAIEDLGNQWHLKVMSKVVPKKGDAA